MSVSSSIGRALGSVSAGTRAATRPPRRRPARHSSRGAAQQAASIVAGTSRTVQAHTRQPTRRRRRRRGTHRTAQQDIRAAVLATVLASGGQTRGGAVPDVFSSRVGTVGPSSRSARNRTNAILRTLPGRYRAPNVPDLEGGYTGRQKAAIVKATEKSLHKYAKARGIKGGQATSHALAEGDKRSRKTIALWGSIKAEERDRIDAARYRRSILPDPGSEAAAGVANLADYADTANTADPKARAAKIAAHRKAVKAIRRALRDGGPELTRKQAEAWRKMDPARDDELKAGTKEQQADRDSIITKAGDELTVRAYGGLYTPSNLRVLEAPYHVTRAFIEDPLKTAGSSLKQARDMIVGLPGGIAVAVTHPEKALKALAADYSHRYGKLVRGDTAGFRQQVKDEGATSYVLDASGAASLAGRGFGRAARAGTLGPRAKTYATTPRPKLRTGGNTARDQALARNLFKLAGQRALDTLRERKQRPAVVHHEAGTDRYERGTRGASIQPGPGEVVPLSSRILATIQKRQVATEKGRTLIRMKAEQRREVHRGALKDIGSLNKQERRGFKYVVQLGLPDDPAIATKMLELRRDQIAAARKERGTVIPRVLRKTNDELATIEKLLAASEATFTTHLREIADQARGREVRVSAGDPGLNAEQRLLRRYSPQAEMLGVERIEHAVSRDDAIAAARKDAAAAERRLAQARRAEAMAVGKAQAQATARRRSQRHGRVKKGDDLTPRQAAAVTGAKAEVAAARLAVKDTRQAVKDANALPRGKYAESTTDYINRVRQAAEDEGLVRPAYFPSEKRPTIRYADYAPGGTAAVAGPKAYTGELFRTGREDTRPEVLAAGLARNIKRKHNWNLVARNFDRHAFAWGRNRSITDLLEELDRRGIDPRDVAFWNPKRYREAREGHEADVAAARAKAGDRTGIGEDPTLGQGVGQAVDHAAFDYASLATKLEDFRGTSSMEGWSAVPKAAYDEIHADTRPSGAFGRSLDIVKGKQSRILLGLGNVSWLQFQVASNALLTGIGGTGPLDIAKAQLWWRKLSDAEREAIDPYVGTGAFHLDVDQTKLGAATNSRIVNAWRAMKETWWLQKLGRANPLDLLFRADHAQNNFFRRSVLYSQVKRDAYRRMGQNTRAIVRLQQRFEHILTLGPEDQMKALVRNRTNLEEYARHVNDMLGDYSTYTAFERRVLSRNVMFYGFLRFSLRFAFYTMPVRHPVMTALLTELGKLNTEETRRILGGDELPWALGRIYWKSDGSLKQIDLSRANPALNFLTSIRGPYQLPGMFPPIVASAFDQIAGKELYKDRPFMVQGETRFAATNRDALPFFSIDRGRIFLGQMLRLAAPYRIAEQLVYEGRPQGSDTLLWDQRPTVYKDPDIVASIEENRGKRLHGLDALLGELVPFIPQPGEQDVAAAQARRDRGKPKAKDPILEKYGIGGGDSEEEKKLKEKYGIGADPALKKLEEKYGVGETKGAEAGLGQVLAETAPALEPLDALAHEGPHATPIRKEPAFAHPQRANNTARTPESLVADGLQAIGDAFAAPGGKREKVRVPRTKKGKVSWIRTLSNVPRDFQGPIGRWGHLADAEARKYGLGSGAELVAKIIKLESGYNMAAVSGAGARAAGQFMPADRQAAIDQWGVDPWRSVDEAVHAVALRMSKKGTGLARYNPGGGQGYIDSVLGQDVGHGVKRRSRHDTRIVSIPHFPGEEAAAWVVPKIEYARKRFHIGVSDAFDRDRSAGHKSPGHNVTGTAVDFTGTPQETDELVKWAVAEGYTVYYDGSFGSIAMEGHGPGDHAHVEFEQLGDVGGSGPSFPAFGGGGSVTGPGSSAGPTGTGTVAKAIDTAAEKVKRKKKKKADQQRDAILASLIAKSNPDSPLFATGLLEAPYGSSRDVALGAVGGDTWLDRWLKGERARL